ncbi:MAG: hypothetical protein CTY36_01355 [Methylocystis sp.]|jgi:hypothetical protein|nr:MAG: hypothetical protein CTY36_01355 [Methylocystis sp.]
MKNSKLLLICAASLMYSSAAWADRLHSCDALNGLVSWSTLKTKLKTAVTPGGTPANGGFGFNMWATIVANDGTVCAVAYSGNRYTDQWLESRVISAQKAYTANGLSLSSNTQPSGKVGVPLSTANLYAAVQPGGSLYGLQFANPVDPGDAYDKGRKPADPYTFGTPNDTMVGDVVGGTNVFGGGLALYAAGAKVGGIGVSGDTSCTDHFVAWKLRNLLGLDKMGAIGASGVTASGDNARPDNIVFDIPATSPTNTQGNVGVSAGGFGHPSCVFQPGNPSQLPAVTH